MRSALGRVWFVLAAVVFTTGCSATGMGSMPYFLDPTTKTSFGFVFDGTTQTFSGSYHDKARDVDLKGTGVLKAQPPPVGVKSKGGCVGGDMVPYQSQNPNNPGEGFLILVLCDADGSGGPSGDDFMAIQVLDGPYAGYLNSGTPSGNITVTGGG